MADTTTGPKAGLKTTEFWIMIAVQGVGLLFDSGVFSIEALPWLGPLIGGALHVAGVLGYGPARAKVKAEFEARRAEVRVATLNAVESLNEAERAGLLAKILDPDDPTGT